MMSIKLLQHWRPRLIFVAQIANQYGNNIFCHALLEMLYFNKEPSSVMKKQHDLVLREQTGFGSAAEDGILNVWDHEKGENSMKAQVFN
ncbi:hypothetical protein MKW98_031223 [Papaver atlanticum]|uniref:Uncharacterized protein n=1 Tax=Papaver atlanticum TaxID=357466 RepID=A0AAD4RYU0_9MAGN|nr:hypothetical protein MKW98_031223 [Papaver atlanticum]